MATYVVYDNAVDRMVAITSDEREAHMIARRSQRFSPFHQSVDVYDAATCSFATDDPRLRAIIAASGGTAL